MTPKARGICGLQLEPTGAESDAHVMQVAHGKATKFQMAAHSGLADKGAARFSTLVGDSTIMFVSSTLLLNPHMSRPLEYPHMLDFSGKPISGYANLVLLEGFDRRST